MSPARLRAYILLLIVSIIWGAAVVVTKYTFDGIAPLPFLTYRFLISAVVALFALSFTWHKLPNLRNIKLWSAITIYSFLSTTFALGFLFLGLDRTTVLNLTIMTLAAPLLAEYAGVIFLGEHISKREKIGTLIAVLGTLFTLVEPLFQTSASLGGVTGNVLVLAYLAGDIASVILLKKMLRRHIDPYALTNISFVIALVTILPITIIFMGIPEFVYTLVALEPQYHLGVIYMAIFSGTIAYTLRAKAQKTIEVGEASLFAYVTPIFSAPLAILFLREKVTPLFVVGAIIVAVGVAIAETKTRKR